MPQITVVFSTKREGNMQPQPQRPTGVTILAILAIIGGALGLCGGILGLVGGGLITAASASASTHVNTGLIFVFSVIALIIGVGELVFGIGALQLKSWAWPLGVGVLGLGILLNIIDIAIQPSSAVTGVIGILINAAVLYYLFQRNVQVAFGRVAA
jgi:hypothetical protein